MLAGAGALIVALGGATAVWRLRLGLGVQAVGMAVLGAAGVIVVVGGDAVGAAWRAGVSPALGLDGLSGFFLALLAVTAVPALIYARDYLRSGVVGALLAAFLLALSGLLAARDVSTFLVFWELMTVAPAAAILVARPDAVGRSSVFAYVAITHLGGAGVWIALLLGPGSAVAAVAALVGFGTKAGLVPLHSWLPRAHPVAPAPFSALMSGLMVKVALYGLIRFALPGPAWLGFVLLGVGVASALGGALWALVQHDLKRLLAYSTIENVGVIVAALGASVLIADPRWSALAFAAALLHTANHAVFKALLFLGAGAIERATGTLSLDRLGGIARTMPWTGAAMAVGCAAIAGLPPLNGFASEWLALRALAELALEGGVAHAAAGAAALAGIAATAALALLCFVMVAGRVLLGAPRGAGAGGDGAAASGGATMGGHAATAGGVAASRGAAAPGDAPGGMRAALLFLAALCVALGVAPGLLLPRLAELAPVPVHVPTALGLDLPGAGSLPLPALALALVVATALLIRAGGSRRAAPAPTWVCGQPVTPALGWTAAGFTKPLRLIVEVVLRPRRTLALDADGALRYTRVVGSPAGRLLYRPAVRGALRGAAVARRLQTGNVRTYAAYLLALVLGLLALVQTGALG
ncbi:MAG TPA: proton-conducting transporter membrane subunit [Solirubrobacter sp.]|nr:proton-conducting transporter membrane subunit [Solirubrobacter sp.]